MIRVLIVDDHALIRSSLRLMLDAEDDITVEDEARCQGSPGRERERQDDLSPCPLPVSAQPIPIAERTEILLRGSLPLEIDIR